MWKTVINNYEINESGQLRNSKTGRLLKPKTTKKGYSQYGVSINGKYKDVSAHRAVAEAFIPNPNGLATVNHIDGDKKNNHYSNLEWLSNKDNMAHAFDSGIVEAHNKRKVLKLNEHGLVIASFDTLTEAAKTVDGNTGGITQCCKGIRKTYKGFKWQYTS